MEQCDNNGNGILNYASRYSPEILDLILKSKFYNKKLLRIRNQAFQTCVMYASKYNSKSVKILMEFKDCTNDLLYTGHMHYGSVLTLAARFQPKAIKSILNSLMLDWKVLNTVYDKLNFIAIGCMYNAEVIKFAIESNIDITHMLITNTDMGCPMILATKFQPDAIKYILDSKYGSESLLKCYWNNVSILNISMKCQPMALKYIIESKYATRDYLRQQNRDTGYRFIDEINSIYDRRFINVDDLKENLKKLPLINIINERIIEKSNINECSICYTYKCKVFFVPCGHTVCVGCGFRLKQCPYCNNNQKKEVMRLF